MPSPSPQSYVWLVDASLFSYAPAACVTVVVGLEADLAVASIGGDLAGKVAVADVDPSAGLRWVSTASLENDTEPRCLLVEDNGWEGSRTEVLKTLSKRGKAASVFWNVNGLVLFGCARRGKVLSSFEVPGTEDDDVPRSLVPYLRLSQDDVHPVMVAMAMLEKFTGVTVTQETAASLARDDAVAYPVTDALLSHPVTAEELLALEYPSRELVAAVRAASQERRWRLAQWAARQAVDDVGIANEPGVAEMLQQFNRPGPARITASCASYRRTADRWSYAADYALSAEGDLQRWEELKQWGRIRWAMEALAYTASDDVTAPLGATYCAAMGYSFGSEERRQFLAQALAILDG